MFDSIFEIIFLIGLGIYLFFVWGPAKTRFRRQKTKAMYSRPLDVALDFLGWGVWQVLPLIAIFSPWLDFSDYRLPDALGWLGAVMLFGGVALIWRAYADLGKNWSPRIEVTSGQGLVTEGVYRYLRHPVYFGMLLWALSYPLLLQNWVAGFAMLIVFAPLFLLRIPQEERMMTEHFGDEYRTYMARTGRLIPRLR